MSTVQTFIRPVEVSAPPVGGVGGVAGVDARTLPGPPASAEGADWSAWFEAVYRESEGDAAKVPWGDRKPSPALVEWLNSEAPAMVRPGACVTVTGCGLGDDVRELADRGYDVTGFDVSPTAVAWARKLHPAIADRIQVADLLEVPAGLRRRADLVVEVSTIQAVHPEMRGRIVAGIASLARPRGVVLAVCRARGEGEALVGPPFALKVEELSALFSAEGFAPAGGVEEFLDGEEPPVRRLRAAMRRV